MNAKLDEQLSRLAFGDLSPQETKALEERAQADPELAKVLAQYRSMKDGLRTMASVVPPDQLSKERLRDAILAQGLRPGQHGSDQNSKPAWSWMWIPVATACAAFAFMSLRPHANTAPRVVIDPSVSSGTLAMNTRTDSLFNAPKLDLSPMRPAVSAPKKGSGKKDNLAKNVVIKRKRKRPIILESKFDAALVAKVDAAKPNVEPIPKTAIASYSPVAPQKVTPVGSSGPIILIDAMKDASTGANNATEVGTASNVLVGG